MNVYDFDKTIYYPDSEIAFVKWCAKRHIFRYLKHLPKTLYTAFLFQLRKKTASEMQLQLLKFAHHIPNLEEEVERFWDANEKNIQKWYLDQKKPDDYIITASPEFLIKPIAKRLGVNAISTRYNVTKSYREGPHCYGIGKLKAIIEAELLQKGSIDNFYSDNISDLPIAQYAKKAFLVKDKAKRIVPWECKSKDLSSLQTKSTYVIAFDIGTTFIKAVLCRISNKIEIIEKTAAKETLIVSENGKNIEQDSNEWWNLLCKTSKDLLQKTGIDKSLITGISFCSQSCALVLVDKEGNVIRAPMNYLDRRAEKQFNNFYKKGIRIFGMNIHRMLKGIRNTNLIPAGAYNPIWKYKWVEENEPKNFKKIYRFLDVGDYILLKCTGKFVRTIDSIYVSSLNDCRKGRKGWSMPMIKAYGIREDHLAEIINCTDIVGTLSSETATQMGLAKGTSVIAGAGDVSMVAIGSGISTNGQSCIYCGTSGSVSTITEKLLINPSIMMTSIKGASPDYSYLYGELETAGKCLESAIQIVIGKGESTDELYNECASLIEKSAPGANGVLFTPFLHGCKTPFEDNDIRSSLSGLRLETKKKDILRAVAEGICYHYRWILESQEKLISIHEYIRFAGGLARMPIISQMLADITGHPIETIKHPQYVGAIGAAAIAAVGLGKISLDDIPNYIEIERTYMPNKSLKSIYNKAYKNYLSKVNYDRQLAKRWR